MDFLRKVTDLYRDLNPATLSGAIDIIVVRQPDGSLRASPFHVRFGKLTVFHPGQRVVRIRINGEPVDVKMKVGRAGACYFVREDEEGALAAAMRSSTPVPTNVEGEIGQWNWGTLPVSETPAQIEARDRVAAESETVLTAADTAVNMSAPTPPPAPTVPHSAPLSRTVSQPELEMQETSRTAPHTTPTSPSPPRGLSASWFGGFFSRRHTLSEAADEDNPDQAGDARRIRTKSQSTEVSINSEPVRHTMSDESLGSGGISAADAVPDISSPPPPPLAAVVAASAAPGAVANVSVTSPLGVLAETEEAAAGMASQPTTPLPDTTVSQAAEALPATPVLSRATALAAAPDTPTTPASGSSTVVPSGATPAAAAAVAAAEAAQAGTSNTDNPPVELAWCETFSWDWSKERMAEVFAEHRLSFEKLSAQPDLVNDQHLIVRIRGQRYLPWKIAGPVVAAYASYGQWLPDEVIEKLMELHPPTTSRRSSWLFWRSNNASLEPTAASASAAAAHVPSNPTSPPPTPPSAARAVSRARDEADREESPAPLPAIAVTTAVAAAKAAETDRTLTLSSEELESLKLKDGVNIADFTVVSKLQGKATISCRVFLWNYDAKIVISDIDGTITKSDIMGHAAALVGTDWTHNGVASLFSDVARNGYHFLYLSSRSISQSVGTRGYLQSVRQQDVHTLPEGPMLLSPASLFQSLHREVILRRPEEFKIACLTNVQQLFPEEYAGSCFVAGFGNRHTDLVTYRAVGIPDSRIFIIDPKGLIRVSHGLKSSYEKLNDIVDFVFAPLTPRRHEVQQNLTYSNFAYWREPPPELPADVLQALQAP